jgi:hypothetical protein
MKSVSARLAELLGTAEQQHGVVISRQARECGISARTMNGLVAAGWFRMLRSRAFAVAGRPPSPWEDAVAVLLLGGESAVLSHGTAAAIHRVPGLIAPDLPELTVAAPRHPRVPAATLHRVHRLDDRDVDTRRGVRVTTPARTLVDLVSRMDAPMLARILDEGNIAGIWQPADVQNAVQRAGSRGRPGMAMLQEALALRIGEPEVDTVLELRMIRALAPFAPFETQYHLILDSELLILDIAWPRWRVAAEADGWWTRGHSRTKFDRTLHRNNLLVAHGWRVVHLTSTMDDATVRRDVGRLLPPDLSRTR